MSHTQPQGNELLRRIALQNHIIHEALVLNRRLTTYLERRRDALAARQLNQQGNNNVLQQVSNAAGEINGQQDCHEVTNSSLPQSSVPPAVPPDTPQTGYYSQTSASPCPSSAYRDRLSDFSNLLCSPSPNNPRSLYDERRMSGHQNCSSQRNGLSNSSGTSGQTGGGGDQSYNSSSRADHRVSNNSSIVHLTCNFCHETIALEVRIL